ncbi:MAG TPA: O-methyltransferase [Vicinamibacterales bacterium]|jgi:predicted O-methyltransferase YrrM|nr:O-methyltransferase [Vicinamibacterales bacterium]
MSNPSGGAPDERWVAVDRYFGDLFVPPDRTLDDALAASEAAGLPPINVSPCQGKLLWLLARMLGARRILEIGTLGGYSTIWLARALPADGRVVTLEIDPRHADVARGNVARAGVANVVDLRLGKGIDTLSQLRADGAGPFDLIFIDADKPSYTDYLTASIALSRPGTIIVADNVVRSGRVADATSTDAAVQGVRRFNAAVAADARLAATAVQTVGMKGYDGFTILRVEAV